MMSPPAQPEIPLDLQALYAVILAPSRRVDIIAKSIYGQVQKGRCGAGGIAKLFISDRKIDCQACSSDHFCSVVAPETEGTSSGVSVYVCGEFVAPGTEDEVHLVVGR